MIVSIRVKIGCAKTYKLGNISVTLSLQSRFIIDHVPGCNIEYYHVVLSFQLLGMGIAAMGFWILIEKDKLVRDAFDVLFDPSILLCFAGCIIFFLGFFGCLGALRENICLLKTVRLRFATTYNYTSNCQQVLIDQRLTFDIWFFDILTFGIRDVEILKLDPPPPLYQSSVSFRPLSLGI